MNLFRFYCVSQNVPVRLIVREENGEEKALNNGAFRLFSDYMKDENLYYTYRHYDIVSIEYTSTKVHEIDMPALQITIKPEEEPF